VDTEAQIDLAIAAKMADISIEDIKKYNPAFKQWATDPQGPHHLLLPVDKAGDFKIALAKMDKKDRVQWYRHKIRSGESLSVIAHKYRISTSALQSANKLKSSRIRAGKYLMVPIAANHKIVQLSATAVQKKSKQTKATAFSNQFHYTVKKGDSFWKIARRFKISHKKLASLNGLSAGDTLSIGQQLIIDSPETRIKPNQKSISYQVQSGDSLYVISRRFNVSINELKNWNNLNNKKYLRTGQTLKVYLPHNKQPI
jgi:membrane-bound lytic murein transglycosylase D